MKQLLKHDRIGFNKLYFAQMPAHNNFITELVVQYD